MGEGVRVLPWLSRVDEWQGPPESREVIVLQLKLFLKKRLLCLLHWQAGS